MSISSAINAARSGLITTGLQAENVANNVANASTPGYVQRSVVLGEVLVGNSTLGVRSEGISRSQNEMVVAQRRLVSSDLAQSDVLTGVWTSLSAQLGTSADDPGLFQSLSGLESAVKTAAASPESSASATALVTAAKDVADQFNSLSQTVTDLRAEADREIATGVSTVNTALKQVEDLNTRITNTQANSNLEASLLDERQRVLDTIAEYMPIEVVPRDFRKVDIITTEGVFLISGTAREIEFDAASNLSADRTIENGGVSGLTVDGTVITPGARSFGAISSGMFGALVQLRDQDLPAFNDQLDAVADDIITRLSNDTIDPTTPDGTQGLFVDLGSGSLLGKANRIEVNPLVDPDRGGLTTRVRDGLGTVGQGDPGNATILNSIDAALTSADEINAAGLQGFFSSAELGAQLSSLAGQAVVSNETVLASNRTQYNTMVAAEQENTGVDMDAQMQQLLVIEQSYSANARVIQVASELLNRLMEL